MPEGLLVTIMYEEGDTIKEDPEKGVMEIDPIKELAEGETNACARCGGHSFNFRFEELWDGRRDCGCGCNLQGPIFEC